MSSRHRLASVCGVLLLTSVLVRGAWGLSSCLSIVTSPCIQVETQERHCCVYNFAGYQDNICTTDKWTGPGVVSYTNRRSCLGNLGACTMHQIDCP